jgi:hypothetical protein
MAKRTATKTPPIVWETPDEAPGNNRRGFYHPFAEELRKHPNKWARLPLPEGRKPNYADATSVREARLTAFRPPHSFEAVCRGGITYVRYVGNGAS